MCKARREEDRQEDRYQEDSQEVIGAVNNKLMKGAMPPSVFMESIFQRFSQDPILESLLDLLNRVGEVRIRPVPLSVQSLLAIYLTEQLNRPVVLLVKDSIQARTVFADCKGFSPHLPLLMFLPSEKSGLQELIEFKGQGLIVTPQNELELVVPDWRLPNAALTLSCGCQLELEFLANWFADSGYERVDMVTEPGEYAIRGCVVDFFSGDYEQPVRVEFADEVIFSLRSFDPLTQRSSKSLQQVRVFPHRPGLLPSVRAVEILPQDAVLIGREEIDVNLPRIIFTEGVYNIDLGYFSAPSYLGNLKLLQEELASSIGKWTVVALSENRCAHLRQILGEGPEYTVGDLSCGFVSRSQNWTVLSEREIYGVAWRRVARRRFRGIPVDNLISLRPGDYVVHIDYGVGLFMGTKRLVYNGVEKEYLVIQYDGNDRIYVPVDNLGLIDRYVGTGEGAVRLDKLGSRSWLYAKARAARATADYAEELTQIYARRQVVRVDPLSVEPSLLLQLEASFPYEETPDQLGAILAVQSDLNSGRIMDRLVCGDVGFGKTEVALRAAFQVAMNCRQVALLVPTTVLGYQHWQNFTRRLKDFPLRVEMLSRFVPVQKQIEIIRGLKEGTIDIVIGTQVLLSPKIKFANLGLLIIDEEHRFGVKQKELLRRLRSEVNVLSLSATPIPRTLYMALTGLKDISVIHSPPPGRKDVLTEIAEWDDRLIQNYVYRELDRGGQVFFVHNEIKTLAQVERRLRHILTDVDIIVAHGRMRSKQLADIYLDFAVGKHQLLLSTAIIESGLDLPNVNTIIVHQAERFGLADLHQLRGRVGRATQQAYALFLVSPQRQMTVDAHRRLSALLAYSQPGAGYRLALRDMEIRGAGNLLGVEQHGHISRIGLTLYTRMLADAVAKLRGAEPITEPRLKLDINAYIPEGYIPDTFQRIAIYKRLLSVENDAELEELRQEIIDRFGNYPLVVENLFLVARIRIRCRQCRITEIKQTDSTVTVVTPERQLIISGGLAELLECLDNLRG